MNYSFLNLIAAIALSVLIIFGWQHFYEKPKLENLAKAQKQYSKQLENIKKTSAASIAEKTVDRQMALEKGKRVLIKSGAVSGSIGLQGLRFDDLTLLRYKTDLEENSKPVVLFSPSNSTESYFAEVGWLSNNKNIMLPLKMTSESMLPLPKIF